MDDIVWSALSIVVTIAGTAIAINNALNDRFQKLQGNLSGLVTEQAVDSTKIEEKLLFLEHRIVSNKELIEHRTSRFLQELQHILDLSKERDSRIEIELAKFKDDVARQNERLEKQLDQMQGYLQKSGYHIRE